MGKKTAKERFESKYIKLPNGCWQWIGARLKTTGHGNFRPGGQAEKVPAHRYSYELYVGPLGKLQANHKCDNGWCVNPDHIEPGTQLDNMQQASQRGRLVNRNSPKHEGHGRAKLNWEAVREIRKLFAKGEKIDHKKYGVNAGAISKVVTCRTWIE